MATDPMTALLQYLTSQMGPAAGIANSQIGAAASIYGSNTQAQIVAAQIAQAQAELQSKLQMQLVLAQMQQSATQAGVAAQLQAAQNNLSAEIWKIQTTLAEQQAQFKAQFGLDVAQFNLSKQMLEAQQFANPNDWVKQAYYLHNQSAPQGGQMTGAQQVPTPTYTPSTPTPPPSMNWTPPSMNMGPSSVPYNPPPVPTLGGPLPGGSSSPLPGGGAQQPAASSIQQPPPLPPQPYLLPQPPTLQPSQPTLQPSQPYLQPTPSLQTGGYHASSWDDFIKNMTPEQQQNWYAGHGQTVPGAAGGMMPTPGGLPPALAGLNQQAPTPPPGSAPTATPNEVMVPDGQGGYKLYRWNPQDEIWEPVDQQLPGVPNQVPASASPMGDPSKWGAYEQGKPIQVPWMQTDTGGWRPVNLEGTGLPSYDYNPPKEDLPKSPFVQSGGWPMVQNLQVPDMLPPWLRQYMGLPAKTPGAAGGMNCGSCPMCRGASNGMERIVVGENGPEVIEAARGAINIIPMNNAPGGPTPYYNVTPANDTAASLMPERAALPMRYQIQGAAGGYSYGGPADSGSNGYGYSTGAYANQPWLQNLSKGKTPGYFPTYGGPSSLSDVPNNPFGPGMPKVPPPHQIGPQNWNNMLPSEQQMALGYYRALGWYPDDVTELIRRSMPATSNASGITGWRL